MNGATSIGNIRYRAQRRDHVRSATALICAPNAFSALEMSVLLETLARRIDRFHLIDASRG